jgi:general secretion pathway protein D
MTTPSRTRLLLAACAAFSLGHLPTPLLAPAPLLAQAQPPAPPSPPPAPDADRVPTDVDRALRPAISTGRRNLEGPPTKLAFRDVRVEQLIPFIVDATGKVVVPQQGILTNRVTILNDTEIPRNEALDLVFLALLQNNVAVVETDTTITLRDIGEITRQDVPVLGPSQSVLERTDRAVIVEKVFALNHNSAKNIGDIIKGSLPDFAKITIDEESNQVAVLGNIALLQRLERLIGSLDRPASGAVQAETFRLRFADANVIKANIDELFAGGSTARSGRDNQNQNQGRAFRFANQGQAETPTAASGELRVTANTQQNSVSVVADPAVLAQIRTQIETQWDLPLPDEAVIPKIYDLKHSDPVKVRDLLQGLFGSASTARTTGGGNNNQNQQNQSSTSSQGVGRLAGQFSFQAIPETGRLVVVAKSPDNITVIDKIIEGLDQPQSVGLPVVIELKHASAEDLAEQINTLLALDGTLASIRRAESGLSQSTSSASPFASEQTDEQAEPETNAAADAISFWWQRSRPPTDRRNASSLIGQIRIVPVWRQNALLVAAPPEYTAAVTSLVERLDQPGRQVLISAIIAEISRDDATSLGLRWSSETINPNLPDNSVGVGVGADGTSNNFASSLFDTSVLNVNTDVNLLLQALSQKTDVSILSEPKVFTSDNQEAEFFDGQDIPFITDSQTTDNGTQNQSFDYRAVGIQLRVRPRITVRADVDLRVNVELSSINPGQTLFGGFIVERRETTTQLIVQNGQTIVISGILRSEESEVLRKVPLLGDIPLLGYLFQSTDTQKTNTELLVFITPIVVNNPSEAGTINTPYRDRLDRMREQLGETTDSPTAAPEASPDAAAPEQPVAPAPHASQPSA